MHLLKERRKTPRSFEVLASGLLEPLSRELINFMKFMAKPYLECSRREVGRVWRGIGVKGVEKGRRE